MAWYRQGRVRRPARMGERSRPHVSSEVLESRVLLSLAAGSAQVATSFTDGDAALHRARESLSDRASK